METYEFLAPCHFGLEAVLKREIQDLGYDVSLVEDGRVTFIGDMDALCRANIFLRTAERVMLQVGRFKAETFDELFEGVRALPWEAFIPADGALVAGEVYAPVFRRNIFHIHMAQLVAERTFQPEQTRRAESEFHVISSDVISIRKDSTLFRSKLQAI